MRYQFTNLSFTGYGTSAGRLPKKLKLEFSNMIMWLYFSDGDGGGREGDFILYLDLSVDFLSFIHMNEGINFII